MTLGTVDLNQMVDADQAVLTTSALPAGDQTITATYSGDTTYEAAAGTTEITVTASTVWDLAPPMSPSTIRPTWCPRARPTSTSTRAASASVKLSTSARAASGRADLSFALAYNSSTVEHPIIVNGVLDTNADDPTPTDVSAVLTIDGVAGSPIDIPTTDYVAGQPFA